MPNIEQDPIAALNRLQNTLEAYMKDAGDHDLTNETEYKIILTELQQGKARKKLINQMTTTLSTFAVLYSADDDLVKITGTQIKDKVLELLKSYINLRTKNQEGETDDEE